MPLAHLPSSATAGGMYLVVIALGALTVLLVTARIWPWAPCSRCRVGRRRSPSGRYWRDCPRCGGSGRRRRRMAGRG